MTLQSRGSDLDEEIAALGPWFHNLHLPGGIRTAPDHPLGDFPAHKWAWVAPALAERGAEVVGVDHDPHYLEQARWASDRMGLATQVTFRQVDVYDLDALAEEFDLVLFMGVLYHLRHPLLGLDAVARRVRTGGTLVLQTLTTEGEHQPEQRTEVPRDVPFESRRKLVEVGWPTLAFIEQRFAGDPTNWWVPNAAAVEAMTRSAGFRIVAHPAHEVWICLRA